MNPADLKQDLASSTAQGGALAARLATARQHAGFVLRTEQLWPALQPTLALLGVYGVAGLLRLPQHLPDGLRLVVVAGWLSLCGWRLHHDLSTLKTPTADAIDRRIEHASALHNRPLATLTDQPAGARKGQPQPLWQAHQQRVLASLGTLRAGWPRLLPASAARRWAGVALLAALAGTGVMAGPSAPGRILAAFIPGRDDPDVPLAHVEAWITPPAYAPEAPVFLSPNAPAPSVPEGARLTVIVTGLSSHPVLRSGGGLIMQDEARQTLDRQSWKMEVTLRHSGLLRVAGRGRTLARWPITVLPDAAPTAAWGPNPGAGKADWRTRLPYEAAHAYGLASLSVDLHLVHPGRGPARTLTVPLPLSGHPKSAKGVITPDLSDDPWAGEEVTGNVVATAVSGHKGQSKPATFRLGARVFHSPVARAVLDLRKRFALGRESRSETATDLAALGETPGPINDHTGMFLTLTSLVAMLDNKEVDTETARTSTTNLLWDLALDIEDRRKGDDASAQASLDVRAAQAAVAQQLQHMRENGQQSPQAREELEARLKTLKDAIARKMQALAAQAMRDHTAIPDLPGFSKAGDKAFSRLMQQLQRDAANGHSADALQRLQQMEDATERMRNATPQDMAAMAQQMVAQQKAREQAAALRDLTGKEASLLDHAQSRLDETLRAQSRKQNGMDADEEGDADYGAMSTAELLRRLGLPVPPGTDQNVPAPQAGPHHPESGGDTPAPPLDPARAEAQAAARRTDRATQHALDRALDELKDEFKDLTGKAPPAFSDAQKSMHDARKALADGDDAAAATAEEKVLDALRKSRQQMQDSMKDNGKNTMPSFLPAFGGNSGGQSGGPGEESQGQGSADEGDDGTTPSDDAEENGGEENGKNKRDPLGRRMGEGGDQAPDDGTHIPDNVARQRAREIEQELRRRDSDRTRPQQELDYLDRLLKPF
ncbi:DUF4175 domain-containing protein [Acetobacter orleanensis]|uniref:Membrane protein n=1 Tax=Acetobacter orleanensis TaxID=104099 RepID=A0A4Y3TMD4_9PROT|nr:DUF4175 family protein [Acetobacter orleanensis]KXV62814.1 hypothetical protein AD949_08560 [Acetobacter orleanensis]PCD80591.1 DUF4175 domain-containing protein [Acetobacter orleanensis]GAN68092.1 hypothetical protein Abol_014_143 [Acetobacter orleanensis JCM 7639]GBR27060.1 hypothetical protein AA0473_1329 [Acetobacter orleanensis NRIC 0473]GEB81985.1 membrane protein [Acetobacter orleanensis]